MKRLYIILLYISAILPDAVYARPMYTQTMYANSMCTSSMYAQSAHDTLSSANEAAAMSVNTRTAQTEDALQSIGIAVYNSSASASSYKSDVTLSSLSLSYLMRNEKKALLPAYGNGISALNIEAQSYMHLNRRNTVEANASYLYGEKKDICWNSSSDYMLLWPYIAADSIGGNLTTEQYSFGGSYSQRSSNNRFTYGIEGSYRALHEFRRIDPRPRNITSDVQAGISGGYNTAKYYIGIYAGIRVYSQEHSVDYFSTSGANTSQLPMTGLGSYYKRFAGSSQDVTDYNFKGSGFSVSAQLIPLSGNGLSLMTGYTSISIERQLPQINNIPITVLNTESFALSAAYHNNMSPIRWGIGADARYEIRRGDENLLNTGTHSQDMILASFTMFECNTFSSTLTAGAEFMQNWGYLFIRPCAELIYTDAGYRYPARLMKFLTTESRLDIGARYISDKWIADFTAGGGYATTPESSLHFPANAEAALRNATTGIWRGITSDRFIFSTNIGAQRSINSKTAIFISFGWQMYNNDIGTGNRFNLGTGLRF